MAQEPAEVQVRPGVEGDLTALTDLYNHYVRETAITFDTVPFLPEERRPWLLSHPKDGPHRLLVAQSGEGGETDEPGEAGELGKSSRGSARREAGGGTAPRILGYATSSPLRPKPAYATSVEVSVYCAPEAAGRGVGTLLYRRLLAALEGEDVHRAYAGIALPNPASVRLHERFGFRHLGTYREVGRKFGRYWDVAWYELPLGPRD
ncbi:phosphinothricin N-acetyltransferase [Streptomyces longispororuber]|uniref:Phosphinothricin N-acetyltransferase n=1 Tax=Streptomyces longispororuber TaxID=68230 RepID=A0A919DRS7_9ACTN|nr:GNAT family N-acetyltransferase [Streptomyces longispororuber]GHE76015.1 phosphinothricin N-acetyltransferase [Streptomyces longispororuber]